MAIIMDLYDIDKLHDELKRKKPLIYVNDIDPYEDHKEYLSVLYTENTIDNIESCECGKLRGRYTKNLVCKSCNSRSFQRNTDIEPSLWMKAEGGFKFISPSYWETFNRRIGGKSDLLLWLTDNSYNNRNNEAIVTRERKMLISSMPGFKRDYGWVCDNLVNILTLVSNNSYKEEIDTLLKITKERYDEIFSNYLPLPPRAFFVVESFEGGFKIDESLVSVIDTVKHFSMKSSLENYSKSKLMSRASANMAKIHASSIHTHIPSKEGLGRRHIGGVSHPFVMRNTVIPRIGKHTYDGMDLPWRQSVKVFKLHILNKLFRMGYSHVNADKLINDSISKYSPVISKIFDILLEEAPNKRIPSLLHRPPTQFKGSLLLLHIESICRDTEMMGGRISSLILRLGNTDYDGDELHYRLTLDNEMTKLAAPFSPHAAISRLRIGGAVDKATIGDTSALNLAMLIKKQKGGS